MSAEIAILNRFGVALAADSAGSISLSNGSYKIFNSNHKLFQLSNEHSVGILVAGNSMFMGYPWEDIIKMFRKHLGNNTLGTIEDYCAEFINYIKSEKFQNPLNQESIIREKLNSFLNQIEREVLEYFGGIVVFDSKNKIKSVAKVIESKIDALYLEWESKPYSSEFSKQDYNSINRTYGEMLKESIYDVFRRYSLNKKSITKLKHTLLFYLTKDNEFVNDLSIILFAGYGYDQIYPSHVVLNINWLYDRKLNYSNLMSSTIDANNLSAIVPLAQKDIVELIIKGINPATQQYVFNMISNLKDEFIKLIEHTLESTELDPTYEYIKSLLNEESKNSIDSFIKHVADTNIRPFLETISVLPYQELAEIAEALISLTSLRRKISFEAETVGGPTDLAIITKGDGFVWLKRKQYFSNELNKP